MTEPEQRRAPRLKSLMAGTITFNNGASSLDCLVRNISDTGARLSVSAAVSLPEVFDLSIPQKGGARKARIKWRLADVMGVTFVDEAAGEREDPAREASLKLRIRQLEAEVARLKSRIAQLTEG